MDIISKIKSLNLPLGEYVVYGSAVMEVHGIRKARDIDIVINEKLYQELKRRGWKRKWNSWRVLNCKMLKSGDNEAYTNLLWKNYQTPTSELIKNAEIIDGVAFMKVEDYLFYKKHLPREKDKEDVRLMEDYLLYRRG